MLNIEEISRVGIGTYRMSYKSKENIDSIIYGIDKGLNLIDTASSYLDGESEKLLSKIKDKRNSIFIISKVGYVTERISEGFRFKKNEISYKENMPFHCVSSEYIKFQLDKSLSRINSDIIDAYLIHSPEYSIEHKNKSQKLEALEESLFTLEEKVKEGKIRYYGVSSNKLHDLDFLDMNDYNSLKIKFPNFKFLQFPFNLIEEEIYKNNDKNIIEEYKNQGFYMLSNRPLNTIYNGKNLRLSFFKLNEDFDSILQKENELFKSLINLIKKHLQYIQIYDDIEDFYPIDFLIKNRLTIGNIKYLEDFLFNHFLPFLKEIKLKEINMELIQKLFTYWEEINKSNNNILLEEIIKDKKLSKDNLPKQLIKNYNSQGIDSVLMGLRKKEYVDSII